MIKKEALQDSTKKIFGSAASGTAVGALLGTGVGAIEHLMERKKDKDFTKEEKRKILIKRLAEPALRIGFLSGIISGIHESGVQEGLKLKNSKL